MNYRKNDWAIHYFLTILVWGGIAVFAKKLDLSYWVIGSMTSLVLWFIVSLFDKNEMTKATPEVPQR